MPDRGNRARFARGVLKMTLVGTLFLAVAVVTRRSEAGIPVLDVMRLNLAIQTALQAAQQVATEAQKLTALADKYQAQLRRYQSIAGPREISALAVGDIKAELSAWLPSDMPQVVIDYHAGVLARTVNTELNTFRSRYEPLRDGDWFQPDTQRQTIDAYKQSVASVAIAHSAAQHAMDDLDQTSKRFEIFASRIDTAHDWKAAVDLRNRQLLEANLLAAQRLRLHAIAVYRESSSSQYELADLHRGYVAILRAASGETGLN